MGNEAPTRISVEAEMNKRAATLDKVYQKSTGVLEIRGSDFLFNPSPPAAEYLLGKLTPEQFTILVRGVNLRTVELRLKQAQGADVGDGLLLQVVAGAINELNAQLVPQGVTVQMTEVVGAPQVSRRGRGRGRGGRGGGSSRGFQLLVITINPSIGPKPVTLTNINIPPTIATSSSSSSSSSSVPVATFAAPAAAVSYAPAPAPGPTVVYAPAPAGYAQPAPVPAGYAAPPAYAAPVAYGQPMPVAAAPYAPGYGQPYPAAAPVQYAPR